MKMKQKMEMKEKIVQSNLSIADNCGSSKKCPLYLGARYIEFWIILTKKTEI